MSGGEISEVQSVVSNEIANVSQGDIIAIFRTIIEAATDPVGFVARENESEFRRNALFNARRNEEL